MALVITVFISKTLTQAGRMEYPVADAGEAQVLLNEIINSIEFTK